jgi:hypothetical protein
MQASPAKVLRRVRKGSWWSFSQQTSRPFNLPAAVLVVQHCKTTGSGEVELHRYISDYVPNAGIGHLLEQIPACMPLERFWQLVESRQLKCLDH